MDCYKYKCDNIMTCSDGNDETDCSKIVMEWIVLNIDMIQLWIVVKIDVILFWIILME